MSWSDTTPAPNVAGAHSCLAAELTEGNLARNTLACGSVLNSSRDDHG